MDHFLVIVTLFGILCIFMLCSYRVFSSTNSLHVHTISDIWHNINLCIWTSKILSGTSQLSHSHALYCWQSHLSLDIFYVIAPDQNMLIGGMRPSGSIANDTFYWLTTGKLFSYANWDLRRPSEHIQRQCVSITEKNGLPKWTNTPCSFRHYILCEF
jgi:hypothetical protein